jgi:hypothetical protein
LAQLEALGEAGKGHLLRRKIVRVGLRPTELNLILDSLAQRTLVLVEVVA